VTQKDFAAHGGIGLLLSHYQGSPYFLLRKVVPEYKWLPWKFTRVSQLAFSDPDSIQKVIEYVQKNLNIKSKEDWNRISIAKLKELGVDIFFEKAGGISAFVNKYIKSP